MQGHSLNQGSAVEPLESRRLFSFYLAVNFQPESMTTSMPGYRTDIGRAYTKRANGLTYGWNSDNGPAARQRKSSLSPDQKFDTLTTMPVGKTWGVAVPNGTYNVRLVVGDPSFTPSHYSFTVEGVQAIDRTNNETEHWQEAEVTVTVSDGRLSLAPGNNPSHNAINFIEIQSADVKPPQDLSWRYSAPYSPFGRVEPGVVQVGNKLYVIGGFFVGYDSVSARVDILNLDTKKWTRGANTPGPQTHMGMATDGRYIYSVGGQFGPQLSLDSTNKSWRYDTLTNKWSTWVTLPQKRYGGTLAYVNHQMHYIGGDTADRITATTNHWVLDFDHPEKGWQTAPALPAATDHAGHVVEGGKIYLFGGENDHGRGYFQHAATYSFDPAKNRWTQLADMPTASSHFEGNVVVINGEIWALGGQVDAQLLTDEVRSYNPATNSWRLHAPLLEKRKAGFSYAKDGVIYYGAGDSYHNGQPVETMISRLPKSARTMSLASISPPTARVFSTAQILRDDDLLALI
jgi:N-acetylneuraminic acid mutarotase